MPFLICSNSMFKPLQKPKRIQVSNENFAKLLPNSPVEKKNMWKYGNHLPQKALQLCKRSSTDLEYSRPIIFEKVFMRGLDCLKWEIIQICNIR